MSQHSDEDAPIQFAQVRHAQLLMYCYEDVTATVSRAKKKRKNDRICLIWMTGGQVARRQGGHVATWPIWIDLDAIWMPGGHVDAILIQSGCNLD